MVIGVPSWRLPPMFFDLHLHRQARLRHSQVPFPTKHRVGTIVRRLLMPSPMSLLKLLE